MKCHTTAKEVGKGFEADPVHGAAFLAHLLASDKNLAVQVLDYLLYQYATPLASTVACQSLFDENLPLIVDEVVHLHPSSREQAWLTLFSWVNHRAGRRKVVLLETSLTKGAMLADDDWISARWAQLESKSRTRIAISLSQKVQLLPCLPSLFPIGRVIVLALRSPRYALGIDPSQLLSCLENLVAWGGREFCLSLPAADRSFLANRARSGSLGKFPALRSAATRFALAPSVSEFSLDPELPPAL